MPAPRPRIALYGHDTLGLGHLRRNLALASAFAGLDPRPATMLLSGASEAGRFALPAGAELVTVPSIAKDVDGRYGAGRLPVGLHNVVAIRRGILTAALEEFAPDLLVVDKVPLGLNGELAVALRQLRRVGRTRIVLGLRDVLDDPSVASAEWREGRMSDAVRELYDEIWVYGDPRIHDVIKACAVPPSLRGLVRYTGYLATRPPAVASSRAPADRPYVLATVGGGQDGLDLAVAFAQAPLPDGFTGVLLTGPQMSGADVQAVESIAAARDDLVVQSFTPDVSAWIAEAAAVIAMGGANTTGEILATDVPALLVPRERPRREQLVRARSLAARGLVDWMPQADAGPAALGEWITRTCARPDASVDRAGVALDGLACVATLAAHALAGRGGVRVAV